MGKAVYRKKICPHCGIEHRKRRMFCSQRCHALSRGPMSEETKQKISEAKKEWYKTPDGLSEKQKLILNTKLRAEGRDTITTEDFYVEIPDIDSLSDEEKINW